MFKIVSVSKAIKSKEKKHTSFKIRLNILRVIAFFVIMLLCYHVASCIWYIIVEMESSNSSNWIMVSNLQNSTSFAKYMASLYFMVVTVSTIGYGDLLPANSIERIIISLLTIIGIFVYSFTVGTLVQTLTSIDKRDVKY